MTREELQWFKKKKGASSAPAPAGGATAPAAGSALMQTMEAPAPAQRTLAAARAAGSALPAPMPTAPMPPQGWDSGQGALEAAPLPPLGQMPNEEEGELARLRASEEGLQELLRSKVFAEDLAAIHAHNPQEKAKSIEDLGELFLQLRAQGLEVLEAYDCALFVQEKRNGAPKIGDLNLAVGAGEGDFFSQEEVSQMSYEEVLRHLDQIEKSQANW